MSKRVVLVSGDTIPIVRIQCLRQEDSVTPFDLTNGQNAILRYWLESSPGTVRQLSLSFESPRTAGFVRFQQDDADFPDIGVTLYQVQVTDTAGSLITGVGASVLEIVSRQ